jgi:hypothetical protein
MAVGILAGGHTGGQARIHVFVQLATVRRLLGVRLASSSTA